MKIGKLTDVKPSMLFIPETEKWATRFREGLAHFESVGITDILKVPAIYGEGFGIAGTHYYELDNPGGKHQIGVANTALFLSMYLQYNIWNNMPHSHYLHLEDDTRMKPDFLDVLASELQFIPDDFDFLMIGHCCSRGLKYKHLGGRMYEVIYDPSKGNYPIQYPMGGNCYIVAKKALPVIIRDQRDAYANVDISLALHTFPKLKVCVILPRLCEQHNNPLPL